MSYLLFLSMNFCFIAPGGLVEQAPWSFVPAETPWGIPGFRYSRASWLAFLADPALLGWADVSGFTGDDATAYRALRAYQRGLVTGHTPDASWIGWLVSRGNLVPSGGDYAIVWPTFNPAWGI